MIKAEINRNVANILVAKGSMLELAYELTTLVNALRSAYKTLESRDLFDRIIQAIFSEGSPVFEDVIIAEAESILRDKP